MSLAPASSRGFFLNARLAVNGIQCAARSFGTLTAVGRGLLSSMGASSKLGRSGLGAGYQLHRATGTSGPAIFPLNRAETGNTSQALNEMTCSEIGSGDPEHLALGILGIEPEQRQSRKRGFQRRPATADLAQYPALRRQMGRGLAKYAPDDVEPVGAA